MAFIPCPRPAYDRPMQHWQHNHVASHSHRRVCPMRWTPSCTTHMVPLSSLSPGRSSCSTPPPLGWAPQGPSSLGPSLASLPWRCWCEESNSSGRVKPSWSGCLQPSPGQGRGDWALMHRRWWYRHHTQMGGREKTPTGSGPWHWSQWPNVCQEMRVCGTSAPTPCGRFASPWCGSQWSQSTAPLPQALLACLTSMPAAQASQVPVVLELSLPIRVGQHDTSWRCVGCHHLTSNTMPQHPFTALSKTLLSCPYIGWS